MSSLNGFNGQQGRPAARPTAEQPQTGHPHASHGNAPGLQHPGQAPQAWQPQGTHYQQPSPQHPASQQWAPQPPQPQYTQQGYGQPYAGAPDYGQPKSQSASYGGLTPSPDAYAPSFEPYSPVSNPRTAPPAQHSGAPAYAPQPAADYGSQGGYAQAQYGQQPQTGRNAYAPPQAHQWPGNAHADQLGAAARGFEAASYQQQPVTGGHAAYRQAEHQQHHTEPAFAEWPQAQPQVSHGYDYGDANGYQNGQYQGGEHTDEMGFAQPAGGELDQGYGEDDGEEYELEETGRGRRPLMIAAALAGAIFVGGGMAYGYKAFVGGSSSGNPPIVKSATAPAKIKPADAGGKQFAHADSKIMGRLGEGAVTANAANASAAAAAEIDPNGARKVSTLVVGRDGSIQPPAVAPAEPAAATDPAGNVAVPGMMVVDALGPRGNAPANIALPPPVKVAAAPPPQKLVVTPPVAPQKPVTPPPVALQKPVAPPVAPQKPVTIAKADMASADPDVTNSTGSIAAAAAVPVTPKPVVKKVAAAKAEVVNDALSPSAAVTAPSGANGYVAVLASVPRSDSSRMTALKRFADMQQKYGTVLNGKTPDVAEANLGAKGAFHRLVVGPPASRQQAATLCTELKAQGYADCWVTAY